jgi:hypothetical protein
MVLREIGYGDVEWIHQAQDRDRWRAVVNAVMNLRVLAPLSFLVTIVIFKTTNLRFPSYFLLLTTDYILSFAYKFIQEISCTSLFNSFSKMHYCLKSCRFISDSLFSQKLFTSSILRHIYQLFSSLKAFQFHSVIWNNPSYTMKASVFHFVTNNLS